jgi:hypothetical protein
VGLLAFANIDLIKRQQADIRPFVVPQDGAQIDRKHLRGMAVGNVVPNDVDVVRRSPWSNAARSLEQIEDGLGPLVGDGALSADYLTEEVDLLAAILRDANPNLT